MLRYSRLKFGQIEVTAFWMMIAERAVMCFIFRQLKYILLT